MVSVLVFQKMNKIGQLYGVDNYSMSLNQLKGRLEPINPQYLIKIMVEKDDS